MDLRIYQRESKVSSSREQHAYRGAAGMRRTRMATGRDGGTFPDRAKSAFSKRVYSGNNDPALNAA
jgi:hypothetical protein